MWYFGDTPVDNNSEAMKNWDVAGMAMLLYVAVVTPFQLSFLDSPTSFDEAKGQPFWWLDRVVDVYFTFDLFLCFFRPYVTSK